MIIIYFCLLNTIVNQVRLEELEKEKHLFLLDSFTWLSLYFCFIFFSVVVGLISDLTLFLSHIVEIELPDNHVTLRKLLNFFVPWFPYL